MITPRTSQIKGNTIVGLTEKTKNEDELNAQSAKIPSLWQRFYAQDWVNNAFNINPNVPIYGIYSDYESDVTGYYSITAGLKSDDNPLQASLNQVSIKEGEYLVFEGKGPMPETIINTWQEIWRYFSSNPEIKRAYETDFEVYQGPEYCEVYIGVNSSISE